jgi:hypothetical protein
MLLRALSVAAVASAVHVWRLYHSRRQRSNEQVVTATAQGQQQAITTQQNNETNEPKPLNNQDIDAAAAAEKPDEKPLEENLQQQQQQQHEESQSQSEEEETQFEMTLNSEPPIDTPTPPFSSITTAATLLSAIPDPRSLTKPSLDLDSDVQERALSSPLDTTTTTTTTNQRYRTAAEAIMTGKSSDPNNPFSFHHPPPPTLPSRPPLWSGAPGVMPRLSEEVEQSAHSFGRGADSTR